MSDEQNFETLLNEDRIFHPNSDFAKRANWQDPSVYARAAADFESYWASEAERLTWNKPWDQILSWQPPYAKWFLGGKLNVSVNCIDRHLEGVRRNKAAILWEGEPGDSRTITYQQLSYEVNRFANVLKSLNVQKGDRVTIYMPMIPELAFALLACTRIGAIHSVVFGGFSAESLRDRIIDAGAKVVITADGGYRRGGIVPLKENTDIAVAQTHSVENVIVVRRVGDLVEPNMQEGRDLWWHELMATASKDCPAEPMDSEDVLFTLYTSGTTGKPKGIVHTTGGYLTGVNTSTHQLFDLKEEDVYWCTADIGWITGHSYVLYGPLANGTTTLMYEGAPDTPDRGRFWQIIEKYGVNILYTAPTTIRTFMRWGPQWPNKYDLSSLRLLGTVGEPINPEAWIWYHEVVGHGHCPIVDTWWQTETGSIVISPLPGLTSTKPGSATKPLPGYSVAIFNEHGQAVQEGGGYLVLTKPWPSMMRTIWGDDERFTRQYFGKFPGVYLTGDGARIDRDGYIWILGRVDDVINVSGHRIGTMEVESALVDHHEVAESAVIGKAHDVKGQAISAFVTLKEGVEPTQELIGVLKGHVAQKIGAIARPDDIFFTVELPKTRSGKIMRRLLRDIAEGRALGDTTTLADPAVVASLKHQYESVES